jgi:hypothetical protein
MGGLIQTKGTQRLARHFNARFDFVNATLSARSVASVATTLPQAFDSTDNLFQISEKFIAQNAVKATWPADMNDFLYPSSTLLTTSSGTVNSLTFTLPSGFTALPAAATGCAIVQGAAVSSFRRKKTKGITISTTPTVSGTTLTVPLSGSVPVISGEPISFALGKHERLVRRWRWYLQRDLTRENGAAIKEAISTALDDDDFDEINFSTIEDEQRVVVTTYSKLNNNDELIDNLRMEILLMTQSTTSPDRLDPQ